MKDRTCARCGQRKATNAGGRARCDECRVVDSARCADCGVKVKLGSTVCKPCDGKRHTGENHPAWKGGRRRVNGYWVVLLHPDHPMASMRNHHGEVFEHRLVVALDIGRPLARDEHVHHVNHDKADNRRENLQLMTQAEHSAHHLAERNYNKEKPDG